MYLGGDDKKSTQRRQRAASHGQTSGKEFLEKAAPPSFMSKSTDSIEPPLPPKLEDAGKPKLTVRSSRRRCEIKEEKEGGKEEQF